MEKKVAAIKKISIVKFRNFFRDMADGNEGWQYIPFITFPKLLFKTPITREIGTISQGAMSTINLEIKL